MKPQALVFLTHIRASKIYKQFQRVKEQAAPQIRASLYLNQLGQGTLTPNGELIPDDGAGLLPHRQAERKREGFHDLIFVPILMSSLREYDHVWLLEYDVDYAGDWGDFFARTMNSEADFLGTTIYTREQSQSWGHWQSFGSPPEVTCHLRSFDPICRFSKRMIACYLDALRDTRWHGHFEALLPTIAQHNSLRIEDLGGMGPFCPKRWRGANYSNNPEDPLLSPGSFVFRPSRHSYYYEAPETFSHRELLYHPIKPRGSMRRIATRLRRLVRGKMLQVW